MKSVSAHTHPRLLGLTGEGGFIHVKSVTPVSLWNLAFKSLMMGVTLATVAALILKGQPRRKDPDALVSQDSQLTAHEDNTQREPFAPRHCHSG